jgi:hypothetical protein
MPYVDSDPGGRVKRKASLTLEVASIRTGDGHMVRITKQPLFRKRRARKKDTRRIGIGAGVVIGAGWEEQAEQRRHL